MTKSNSDFTGNTRIIQQRMYFPMGFRVLITLASFVVVVAGLKAAGSILIPALFAIFLAILGSAPTRILHQRGVPTVPAAILVGTFFICIVAGLGYVLVNSANAFTEQIPAYQGKLQTVWAHSRIWLSEKGVPLPASVNDPQVQPGAVLTIMSQLLSRLVNTLSAGFLVIILMLFMLVEAADFQSKLKLAFGVNPALTRFEGVAEDVQRYLAIKTVTSGLTGIIVALFTCLMGLNFFVLWGLIAFVLNYVPIIGSIVASVPAILLGLVELDPSAVLLLAIGYFVINSGISHFLEPVLMGRQLGLSALIILLSLAFWGWIWGPAGALLSVPLTMVVKILLEHTEDFSWLGVILGPRPRPAQGEEVGE